MLQMILMNIWSFVESLPTTVLNAIMWYDTVSLLVGIAIGVTSTLAMSNMQYCIIPLKQDKAHFFVMEWSSARNEYTLRNLGRRQPSGYHIE